MTEAPKTFLRLEIQSKRGGIRFYDITDYEFETVRDALKSDQTHIWLEFINRDEQLEFVKIDLHDQSSISLRRLPL